MHKLFVYGTLKKGHGNHRLLEDQTFIGQGLLSSDYMFKMVNLGSFPGLVKVNEAQQNIVGELYEVDDEHFARCDHLEGYHPDPNRRFYNRMQVTIIDQQKNEHICWVYYLEDEKFKTHAEVANGEW